MKYKDGIDFVVADDDVFIDRYTLVTKKNLYGMSSYPDRPDGVNCWVCENSYKNDDNPLAIYINTDNRILFSSLPENVQNAVIKRMDDEFA